MLDKQFVNSVKRHGSVESVVKGTATDAEVGNEPGS